MWVFMEMHVQTWAHSILGCPGELLTIAPAEVVVLGAVWAVDGAMVVSVVMQEQVLERL